MKIKYLTGNLFDLLPYTSITNKVVIHCCNNISGWGSGFVVPLAIKWPETRKFYKTFFENKTNCYLGDVQIIRVQVATEESGDIEVVNMIGQEGVGPGPNGRPPVRYAALSEAMARIVTFIKQPQNQNENYEIWAPLFGAKLAGGDWDFIEQLLIEHFIDNEIPVTICQLPGEELRDSENA